MDLITHFYPSQKYQVKASEILQVRTESDKDETK
jgi:hypothetical protein